MLELYLQLVDLLAVIVVLLATAKGLIIDFPYEFAQFINNLLLYAPALEGEVVPDGWLPLIAGGIAQEGDLLLIDDWLFIEVLGVEAGWTEVELGLHVRKEAGLAFLAFPDLARLFPEHFDTSGVGELGVDGGFFGRVILHLHLLVVDAGETVQVLFDNGGPALVVLLPLAPVLRLQDDLQEGGDFMQEVGVLLLLFGVQFCLFDGILLLLVQELVLVVFVLVQ
jgi:hypothetical protein